MHSLSETVYFIRFVRCVCVPRVVVSWLSDSLAANTVFIVYKNLHNNLRVAGSPLEVDSSTKQHPPLAMKRSNSAPMIPDLEDLNKPLPPSLQSRRGLSTSNVSLPGDFARPEFSPRKPVSRQERIRNGTPHFRLYVVVCACSSLWGWYETMCTKFNVRCQRDTGMGSGRLQIYCLSVYCACSNHPNSTLWLLHLLKSGVHRKYSQYLVAEG